ncbi:MAG TPA: hypothetical protein VGE59_03135 [Patescibacteria group bacterium]
MKQGSFKNQTKVWMAISGACGFTFFCIANFTHLLHGLTLLAAGIQLAINTFVFFSWKRGYQEAQRPLQKLVALTGTIFPVVMASITICRVIIPAFVRLLAAP